MLFKPCFIIADFVKTIGLLLILTITITSCGEQSIEDPDAENKSLTTRKITLSSLTIQELESDLLSAGYNTNQVNAIIDGANTSVQSAGVSDSTLIEEVAPEILKGAEQAIGTSEAGLSTDSEKVSAIIEVIESLVSELNGQVYASASLTTTWSKLKKRTRVLLFSEPLYSSVATYETVFQLLAFTAVDYLDNANINSAYMSTAVKAVVRKLVGELTNAGVTTGTKAVSVAESITGGAVSALNEAGVDASTDIVAAALVSGTLNGLNDFGLSNSDIAAAADEITQAAVESMSETGLAGDPAAIVITIDSIKDGIKAGLAEAGLTSGEIDAVESDINTAIVNGKITININNEPTANSATYSLNEDSSIALLLTGADPEGSNINYSIVTQPSFGSLTGTPPNVTYEPSGDYNGSDYFTFKTNDSELDSVDATIDITVISVNDDPIANSASINLAEDTTVDIALTGSDVETVSLTYEKKSDPAHGTLSGTLPNLVYTPKVNYNGTDSFLFTVKDGENKESSLATISITISAVNDTPVANSATIFVQEDQSIFMTLTGSDVESTTLNYSLTGSGPSNGNFEINNPPSLYYKPDSNFNGVDSFQFNVNDGSLFSADVTVDILVGAVNDIPVVISSNIDVTEDVPISFTIPIIDPDTDDIYTFSIVEAPKYGSLSGEAEDKTFTPNDDYSGQDQFRFKVFDGTAWSDTATISFNINDVNDAPEATNIEIQVNEDTPASITLFGTDSEGDNLSYFTETSPEHGTLSGSAPNLTYTPDSNFSGPDRFTFRVTDTQLDATADVLVTVKSVNDPPVASDYSADVTEDTAKEISLPYSEVDGDAVSCLIVSQPANGSVTQALEGDCTVTYEPGSGFNGSDSFTFKANDGVTDSTLQTVTLNVIGVNNKPIAQPLSVTTNEDASISISLVGTDDDGDSLTYTIVSQPNLGTLDGTGDTWTYIPSANLNGSDSFTYKVFDGSQFSADSTVDISVQAVNDSPTANPGTITLDEDSSTIITLSGSDIDNAQLSYEIAVYPSHGSLSDASADKITYTPDPNFNGLDSSGDSFQFITSDGELQSEKVTIQLNITPVNDAPEAQNSTIGAVNNGDTVITLSANDVENDSLTYSIVTDSLDNTTDASLSAVSGNQVTFTSLSSNKEIITFRFVANDGNSDSNEATVSVDVGSTNSAPVAVNGSSDTSEDTLLSLTLSASDADNDPLAYTIVTQPVNGTLSDISGDQVNYVPVENYNGSDSFTFRASDASLDSNIATYSLSITAVNDNPVATPLIISISEDSTTDITLTGTDIENSVLIYSILDNPTNGSLSGSGSSWIYDPSADFYGSDTFRFQVSDGDLTSDAVVTINITPVNDAPVASDSTVDAVEDTAISVLMSGTDAENDTLVYSIIQNPTKGTLSAVGDNSVTFTPNANANGADSFTFRIYDGTTYSSSATVNLDIAAVNDIPTANAANITTNEDTSTDITLIATDIENSALTYTLVTQPSVGYLDPSGDLSSANLTYYPNANAYGTDSFSFKVNDGSADSLPVTVSITIDPVNDEPVANSVNVETDEDVPIVITLTGSDADNESLTFLRTGLPANGSVSDLSSDQITYYPDSNFHGTDSFTFKTRDGSGALSAEATVSLTIGAINDTPVANSESISLLEDTSADITLSGSDVDTSSDSFVYTLVSPPTKGVLTPAPDASGDLLPNLKYSPNANENGSDSFEYKISDGNTESSPATINISIDATNDCPVITGIPVTTVTVGFTYTSFIPTASDVDAGETLTFSINNKPSWAAFNTTMGELSGTPGENDFGDHNSITISVTDGECTVSLPPFNITVGWGSGGDPNIKWGRTKWGTMQWTEE